MTPEAEDYLKKARDHLDEARKIAGIDLPKAAARSAYYALTSGSVYGDAPMFTLAMPGSTVIAFVVCPYI